MVDVYRGTDTLNIYDVARVELSLPRNHHGFPLLVVGGKERAQVTLVEA